mmetsp:Transcript_22727/g.50547  ORF Transcript_22727/g.50547 Transcript_22727/m.50547 type:complete len:124 (+) Transcript_22727:338-709(+)
MRGRPDATVYAPAPVSVPTPVPVSATLPVACRGRECEWEWGLQGDSRELLGEEGILQLCGETMEVLEWSCVGVWKPLTHRARDSRDRRDTSCMLCCRGQSQGEAPAKHAEHNREEQTAGREHS